MIAVLLVVSPFLILSAQAAEPSLEEVLDYLGFTNRTVSSAETFSLGTYDITLYAEFAGYNDQNEISYYEVFTNNFYVVFPGPEGEFGYVDPPITKSFTTDYQFGLSMLSPDHRYYTERSRNLDGLDHAKVYENLDDPGMYLIGFENQYGWQGDRDFNDLVLSLKRIEQHPVALFDYSPLYPVANETTTFDASDSYDSDGSIVSYQWDFGDGNITTAYHPIITHIYTVATSTINYTVTLTVTDNDGLTNSTTATVPVTNPAILHVSLPTGEDRTGISNPDPWLDECWFLNITGASGTFTVRIKDVSGCISSYDTHLVIALNDAAYNNLVSLSVNGTPIGKSAFKYGTLRPYDLWNWPSGDVYPTWFNDTLVNVGTIGKKSFKDVTVSVTFSNETGARMHFDAYGSTKSSPIPPTKKGYITHNPLSEDSTVVFSPPPNTPPSISGLPDLNLDEDTSLDNAIDLWNYASDAETPDENLIFTILSVTEPDVGVTIDSNRYIDVQPTANWYGTSDVTIQVSDGELTDTDSFTITVNPVNDPPVASDQSVMTTEDTPKNITLTASDIDGDPLTYFIVTGPSHGSLSGSPPNVTYTPDLDYTGSDSFTFNVSDGQAYSNVATVSITVKPENDPPTAPVVDVTPDFPLTTDNLVCTITTPSNDPDGDPITYIYEWYKNDVFQPAYTTNTVPLSATTKGDLWKCVVTPYDGIVNGTSAQDQVTIGNSLPSIDGVDITPDPAYTDDTLTATPYGWYDADGDPEGYLYQWQKWDGATWQDLSGETSNTLSSDNFVKGDQIKVICTPFDGEDYGVSKEDTITISNSPPSAPVVDVTPDFPVTTDDLVCTIIVESIDPDGDTVTYTYEWYKNDVLQPGLTTTTTELSVTIDSSYTHKGEVWKCVVTPHGSDGPPDEDEVTIQNSPPVLDPIGNKAVDEETELSFTATASDPDVEPLTFSLGAGAPAGASITSGGAFTWTPTEAQGPSSYVIRIIVSDGAAEDYEDITVTVNEVNLPPVLNPIGDKTVSEGALLQFTATASDPDIPAQTLIYSASNLPPGATFDPGTRVFNWIPTSGQVGVYYNVHFEVSDGYLMDSEDITITVTSVGPPPPAVGGHMIPITMAEDANSPIFPVNLIAAFIAAMAVVAFLVKFKIKRTSKIL